MSQQYDPDTILSNQEKSNINSIFEAIEPFRLNKSLYKPGEIAHASTPNELWKRVNIPMKPSAILVEARRKVRIIFLPSLKISRISARSNMRNIIAGSRFDLTVLYVAVTDSVFSQSPKVERSITTK